MKLTTCETQLTSHPDSMYVFTFSVCPKPHASQNASCLLAAKPIFTHKSRSQNCRTQYMVAMLIKNIYLPSYIKTYQACPPCSCWCWCFHSLLKDRRDIHFRNLWNPLLWDFVSSLRCNIHNTVVNLVSTQVRKASTSVQNIADP